MGITDIISSIGKGVGYAVPGVRAATDLFDAGVGAYNMMNPQQPQGQQQFSPQAANSPMQYPQQQGPQGSLQGDVANIPLQNQGQQDFLGQIREYLNKQLGGGGGMDFGPIKEAAETNYRENTIPTILERLTSQRGQSLGGSDMAMALGQSGTGLQKDLAAMQSQHNAGAFGPLASLFMQPQQQSYFTPKGPSTASSLGTSLASGAAQAIPMGAVYYILQKLLSGKTEGGK